MNRPRVSVRQMMVAVAVIGAILGVGRMAFHLLVRHTTYGAGLRLDRFDDHLVGMSRAEVSAIHGAPCGSTSMTAGRPCRIRPTPGSAGGLARMPSRSEGEPCRRPSSRRFHGVNM